MPKRRPFFEYKGLDGLRDAISGAGDTRRDRGYSSYDSNGEDSRRYTSRHQGSRHHRRSSRHRHRHHHGRRDPHHRSSRSRQSRYRDHQRGGRDGGGSRRRSRSAARIRADDDDLEYDVPSPPKALSRANNRAAVEAAAAGAVAAAAAAAARSGGDTDAVEAAQQAQDTVPGSVPLVYGRNVGRPGYYDVSPPVSASSVVGRTYASSQRRPGQSHITRSRASRSLTSRIKRSVKDMIPSRFRGSEDDDGYLIGDESEGRVTKPSRLASDKASKKKKKRNAWRFAKTGLALTGVALLVHKFLKSRKEDKKHGKSNAGGIDETSEDNEDDDRLGRGAFRSQNPFKLEPPNAFGFVKVPQGEAFIIERGGKYHSKLNAGSSFVIPFLDRVAFRHTLREVSVFTDVQQCFSYDSISVLAEGHMFLRIEDPVAASYGVDNLYHSVKMLATTCMKMEIARMRLDDVFLHYVALSERVATAINKSARPWGVRCTHFYVENFDIPEEIRMSMGREAEAERLRRADILFSEGQREALINKAEGEMQAQMRMSQARQMDIVNQAIGEAHAIQERGEAIANAMRDIADVVNEPGGEHAMRLRIAEQYINAYAMANGAAVDQGAPLPHDPGQVAEAMNHAIGLLSTLGDPSANTINPYVVGHVPAPLHHDEEDLSPSHSHDGYDDGAPGGAGMPHGAGQMYHDEEDEGLDEDDEEHEEEDGVPFDRYEYHGFRPGQSRPNGILRSGQGATYHDDRFSPEEESSADYEARMVSPHKAGFATPGPYGSDLSPQ